ncbi:hypothetical protein H5U35_05010 [Candidatus Aerophobetes bacterium]|nr:hypothetical protein [Candidatus Aerophobetes bacterium]
MKSRERFLCALNRKKPDRVPIFEAHIDAPIIYKLATLLGIPEEYTKGEYVELYCQVIEKLGLDCVCYPFSIGLEKISGNLAKDKYGRVYRLSPHGEALPAEPLVKSIFDAEKLDMASKLSEDDFSEIKRIIERFGKEKAFCMPVADPYKESWRCVGGMENLLLSFRENEKLVRLLLEKTKDFALKAIDTAIKMGVDAFLMPGDFAYETGLLFSVEDYKRYLKPVHQEIVEFVHKKGRLIAKHSDGNIWPLIDEWIEVGFDGIHPIQPQCMDIKEVKEYVKGKLAVIGNIDCRNLLVSGSKEEVIETVKKTIEKAAPGGGYIISSSNSIHPGCKAENYIAMVEAAKEYGVYD